MTRKPETLAEALSNLRAAWRTFCETVLARFPERWRPAIAETPRRTYRIILIIAVAHYVIVGVALLYAMATGQFDWRG